MKKLIVLFLFISICGFGQTKLDSILFNKINEYRKSKHLKTLKWDTCGYKATKHHTLYLVKNCYNCPKRYLDEINKLPKDFIGTITIKIKGTVSAHEEDSIQFSHSIDRYKYYGGKNNWTIGEVVTGVNRKIKDGDDKIYEYLATDILNSWKNSPGHNTILLYPDMKYGGCSNIIESTDSGIKGYTDYFVTSTFVII